MSNKQKTSNYNLSQLTSVAVDTVFEATAIAKDGYSQPLRDKLESQGAWTKGWFAEGIGQGLYFYDLKNDNSFEHSIAFFTDGLDRVSVTAGYVGMGLAIAHTGVFSETLYSQLDPQKRSWVFDGIGFYKLMVSEGRNHQTLDVPEFVEIEGDRKNAFYAGAGRALWFSIGEKQIEKLVELVSSFPTKSRGAVWRGVGFASTYAGGSKEALEQLRSESGSYVDHLRCGCAVAILEQGREKVAHRETAAKVLLGGSIDDIISRALAAGLDADNGSVVTDPTSSAWAEKVLSLLD